MLKSNLLNNSQTKQLKLNITDNIVYDLAIETTRLLNGKHEKLHTISWTNGESNLDTEYSQLACECCCEAWNNTITKKFSEYMAR